MLPILEKYLPLRANSSKGKNLQDERKKDHYSHYILRLVFSDNDGNRQLFSRLETMLFRLRFKENDIKEQNEFMDSLNLDWELVGEQEKRELAAELSAINGNKKGEDPEWFKVDFTRVPELVESRKVFLRRGKAYVQQKERVSLVVAEFQSRLNDALEVSLFCEIVSATFNFVFSSLLVLVLD
jgi:DNA primase large subunit